ncbi:ADP-dependent glucokinase/phosphofructokinase, partial [Cellulomonas avistercoris]|uniref:ADP-dependent glucokinase/phosphofructokinase n=1 Tax=Cellulomonas avistercoris TaxID=2762242 RepID=UPI001CD91456
MHADATTRLLLGLAGTVDYEIEWDATVLEQLAVELGIAPDDLDPDRPVHDERDLVASILGFVARGVGGERFVADTAVIEKVAARFVHRVTLGGTGVRAALALAQLDYPSRVHLVSTDEHVRRLLPGAVDALCSAQHDSLDPHLIVQYPRGTRARVGDTVVEAPHANRLIFANDPPSRELVLHPDLEQVVGDSHAFLCCGFNVIRDRALLDDRLDRVVEGIARMAPGSLVLHEDCGYHVPEFAAVVRDRLLPWTDVWSMNEDEMQEIVGRPVDLLDPVDVADAVTRLAELVPARNLVVHSRCWALVVGDDPDTLVDCVAGGVELASTRYRVGDRITPDDLEESRDLPRNPDGLRVARALEQAVPRLRAVATPQVDVPNPTTVGLGDTFAGGFLLRYARRRDAGAATIHPRTRRAPVEPIVLSANQPPARFYAGGPRIREFRGMDPAPAGEVLHTPEDWVGSTSTVFGSQSVGLTTLPDGRLLRDAVAADPDGWLGRTHVERHGSDLILVKLLDAGERLPVHIHPDVPFAQEHLGMSHGKTEGWIALADADAHVAFSRDVSEQELRRWVDTQDVESMLAAMHRIPVRKGDAVYLPAGLPHAIGEGNFVVELQEPTDLSVLLEWAGYPIDGTVDGHLGLGFDVALGAVDRRGYTREEVLALIAEPAQDGNLFPRAGEFFRAHRLRDGGGWEAGFAVVVVPSGQGVLTTSSGASTQVAAGSTVVVPWAAGDVRVSGDAA